MRRIIKEDYRTRYSMQSDKQAEERQKHHTGLYRFLAAVMLFSLLMFGFYHRVSVCGINEAKIEKMMADDSHWKAVIKETDALYQKTAALFNRGGN